MNNQSDTQYAHHSGHTENIITTLLNGWSYQHGVLTDQHRVFAKRFLVVSCWSKINGVSLKASMATTAAILKILLTLLNISEVPVFLKTDHLYFGIMGFWTKCFTYL
ncbi:hypothetical protein CHS0354_034519 [Potamilus streckersoni]|uniref:Uncharacterized protein n=1 Tax=Potamilus streckersoni TaxID=2493646 RepID=A0AAE0SFG1_9BIVA|nr:hypothetical protein CHS0354_034519 [Potamilus streckersoni]